MRYYYVTLVIRKCGEPLRWKALFVKGSSDFLKIGYSNFDV